MKTIIASPILDSDLEMGLKILSEGGVVALPTETVYGLGSHLYNPAGIQKIFTAKGRPSDNPLIAHFSTLAQIEKAATEIPKDFYSLMERFAPGPLTIILKKRECVPSIATANLPTLAVRIPDHPITQKLLEGGPIVAPSANLSGRPSPTQASHVFDDLDGRISLILDGGSCTYGLESTVISLVHSTYRLLRPGSISQKTLEVYLQKEIRVDTREVLAPGMKYRHYAPDASVMLFDQWDEIEKRWEESPSSDRILLCNRDSSFPRWPLSAQSIYDSFRRADQEGLKEVWVFLEGEEEGLKNRLLHAARKTPSRLPSKGFENFRS